MSRIGYIAPEQASGKLAETYSAIKKQMGGVIKLFQALGNSDQALGGYLAVAGLLKEGHLSAKELETIALVSAQTNSCEYCTAAHTTLGKMVGFKQQETVDIRRGKAPDAKLQALVNFVREAISERGRVSNETFEKLREQGYTNEQVPEIYLAISQNVYTNYFNNFNGTEVDFELPESI